jgi:hypothetical protein
LSPRSIPKEQQQDVLTRVAGGEAALLTVHQNDDAWRWHEWLGHVNFSLEKMGSLEIVRGLSQIDHVEQFFGTCVLPSTVAARS